ncbi:MAG: mandelate racemase/muconate lactonizing enzyme family protein [bacterium]
MKINSVEALHLRLPAVHEVHDGTQEVLLVKVGTDDGIEGYGEVVSCSAVAKAVIEAPRSAPRRHGLATALIGADPLDPAACWSIMYEATRWYGRQGVVLHAMSGVDQALWDIVGKVAGRPVSTVWGQRRRRVRAYASMLFPDSARDAAAMTTRCLESGFTAVKFGYGSFGKEREHDHALLDAIVDASNGSADIMIDAGRVWATEEGIERARELFERYPITWLEEPLHEENLDGYQRMAAAIGGRIATGETETTLGRFEELLARGVKVLQPDVGRAGGLDVCRTVSQRAAQTGAWCVPHCFGTGVNLAASLQWMASAEDAPFIEFPLTASDLRNKVVMNPPKRIDGWVIVPDEPGLGVVIDPDMIGRYRQP